MLRVDDLTNPKWVDAAPIVADVNYTLHALQIRLREPVSLPSYTSVVHSSVGMDLPILLIDGVVESGIDVHPLWGILYGYSVALNEMYHTELDRRSNGP